MSRQTIRPVMLADVVAVVADWFTITPEDLRGRDSSLRYRWARQVAYYLCYAMTPRSQQEIGNYFAGRKQQSVGCGIQIIRLEMQGDAGLCNAIDSLWAAIRQRCAGAGA